MGTGGWAGPAARLGGLAITPQGALLGQSDGNNLPEHGPPQLQLAIGV
jgi:hypothetical protein